MSLALAMVLGMTACGANGSRDSGGEKTETVKTESSGAEDESGLKVVTIGLNGTVTDVSPYHAPDVIAYPIEFSLYQNLFTTASVSSQELIPVVGKSIEISEDGQSAVIEIFDNVHDTEGNAIDANDIVFSAETLKKAATQTDTAYIESIKATDDYTVELKLTEPNKNTMVKLLTHIHIVNKEAYEENPDTCPGTSPYRLVSYTSGSEYILEKTNNYWQTDASKTPYDAQANVDRIIFHCIPEKTQMTMALESGEIQMAIGADGREAARFDTGGESADGFLVDTNSGSFSTVLLFNDTADSLCQDINLRKAILYGIDRQAIIDVVLNGAGKVNSDLASETLGGFNEEWLAEEYYPYNAEKAKEYLAQSSYNGETLKLEADPSNGTSLELIQSQLSAIGIKVEIQTFENALWQEEKVAGTGESGWDFCIDGVGGSLVTNVWKVKFNPSNFSTGLPQTGSQDTELVGLLLKAADTQDSADLDAFHDYLAEKAYAIGVYSPADKCITVDTITDICYNGMGYVVPGSCNFDAYK